MGSQFQAFTDKTRIDNFINFFLSLFLLLFLSFCQKSKAKFRILMFPCVCTALWPYMCSESKSTIKELLVLEFGKKGAKIRNF